MNVALIHKNTTNRGSSLTGSYRIMETHRFMQWAPHVGRLVQNPWATLFGAFVLSVALLPLSIHWALLPFCFWMLFVALKIDWALLDRMVIPPLAIVVLFPAIGMGLGIPLSLADSEVGLSPPHLTMQLVFLLGTPFLFAGYRLGRGKILGNWCPPRTEAIFDAEAKPLLAIVLFFMLFDLARITIGWRTGTLDRGYAGEVILEQSMRASTFAGIFGRWNGLWFFFLPFLWRKGRLGGLALRLLLVVALCFYCVIAYASGSRGLLLYPTLSVMCGLYFFVDKPRFQPERWTPVLLICFAAYIYAMDVFRNTTQFQESKLIDLSSRLAATKAIAAGASERQDFAFTTGRALVGVADEVVYNMTPDPIPFAGVADIPPALPWTWVPHLLAPNKPILWDNNDVVVSYTNDRQERTFSAITLSADLYRRVGWAGIPVGLFIFGVVYGCFVQVIVRVYRKVSVVAGVTLVAFLIGALQTGGFTSTVKQTWWIWAYDLPKHLIPLVMIVYMIGGGLGRGLGSYSGAFRPSRPSMPGGPSVFATAREKR